MRTVQTTLLAVAAFGVFGVTFCLSAQTTPMPLITVQPQHVTAFEGASIKLKVSATSATRLSYCWRLNGNDLPAYVPGQFTPVLSLPNVGKGANGSFSVVVSNHFGAVTSQTAVVTINDSVYWSMAIGYINMPVAPGYSLLALQLGQGLTDQTVDRQLTFVQDGSSLFKLDGTGFVANNYLDGWSDTEQLLTVGEGFFFYNPTDQPTFVTVVGAVVEGQLVNQLPAGLSLCTSLIPQAGDLPLLGFPATTGAKAYRYDATTDTYSVYTAQQGEWFPSTPSVGVAEAIFIQEPYSLDWIRTFWINYEAPGSTYKIVQPRLSSEVGEVNFFTFNHDPAFGQVLDIDGVTPLTNAFVGQLYAGTNETESSLSPVGEPLPFQSGAGAGYIRGATVKIPELSGGELVALQLRVWEKCAGDTYEQAVLKGSASGRSEVFTTTAHATVENGGPGLPPRNANGFHSFPVSLAQATSLRVGWVHPVTDGVEVCFATQPGWVYSLEKCGSWNGGINWAPVSGAQEILGTGHIAKVFEATTQQCFYRLRRVR